MMMMKSFLIFFLFVIALPLCLSDVLTAYPSTLSYSGQSLTLSWVSSQVNASDLSVAIYSPTDSAVTDFIGWRNINQTSARSGSTSIPIVNVRDNYVFRLLRNLTEVLAESNIVTFASNAEPTQAHLSVTHDPSVMRLLWTCGESNSPMIGWGLSPDTSTWTWTTKISTSTYSISDMCDAPASIPKHFRDPGTLLDGLLTDLSPSTKYYYAFGEHLHMSDTKSFISPPRVGSPETLQIIAYGDLGVATPFLHRYTDIQFPAKSTTYFVNRQLQTFSGPQMTLHIGDISYARGYAFIWDWFMDSIESIASVAPYQVCIGNHEFDYTDMTWKPSWGNYNNDSGGECGVPYDKRFNMPNSTTQGQNLWYSYDYGSVHFVMMSTEHDFVIGSDQYNWIASDLEKVNKNVTPWIVFSGHRPMYTSSEHEEGISEHLMDAYEPLFKKYKVDLALWGHVHDYERTCGMYDYKCAETDEEGTVHVVIGMAGNTYQSPWMSSNDVGYGSTHHPSPDWVVFRSMNYGYTRFLVNSTHLEFFYHGDTRGEVHDTFVLRK